MNRRLSALILFDPYQTHTPIVRDHLNSFRIYSVFDVQYAPLTGDARVDFDVDDYDVIIIHYTVRPVFGGVPPSLAESLARSSAKIVLFCQDEYDLTENLREFMRLVRVSLVFSCVPSGEIEKVYPSAALPGVRFRNTLAGHVPLAHFHGRESWSAVAERPVMVAHRGRKLPYWYGRLAWEKFEIGQRMREACRKHGLPHDIEWDEHHRIYDDEWPRFLRRARATLITESGSNVFDDRGEVRRRVAQYLEHHPDAGFDEVSAAIGLEAFEQRYRMQQISARAFEAIVHGTALIGYRGDYSGILRADRHYIVLERDFSNIDDVLAKASDAQFLEAIRHRAYEDIIVPGRWSHESFIAGFDDALAELLGIGPVAKRQAPPVEVQKRMAAELAPFATGFPIDSSPAAIPVGRPQPKGALPASRVASRAVRVVVDHMPAALIKRIARLFPERIRALVRHLYRP